MEELSAGRVSSFASIESADIALCSISISRFERRCWQAGWRHL
jgi:hypothetical protein